MKIRITIELSERDRRAIAHLYGQDRLADRETCERYLRTVIDGDLAGLEVTEEVEER